MKIIQDEPAFQPVVITLESKAEVNALYGLLHLAAKNSQGTALPTLDADMLYSLKEYLRTIE